MAVSHFCEVCKKQLPSRNKLFQHIKESGHAVLKHQTTPQAAGGQGRGTSSQLENRGSATNTITDRKRTKNKKK